MEQRRKSLHLHDGFFYFNSLTADQSPGTNSAGQSILLQSRESGSVGFCPLHIESDSVLNWPLVSSWRHTTWRFWTPFPQVLEQGRHPETYQLKAELKIRRRGNELIAAILCMLVRCFPPREAFGRPLTFVLYRTTFNMMNWLMHFRGLQRVSNLSHILWRRYQVWKQDVTYVKTWLAGKNLKIGFLHARRMW